ncbi:MAG: hypothetical protein MK078_18195 [Crocinitomicaceae bacterium]|nr:hypothetical protein [Crocinitomicaceae bacterium]MCH2236169.1 hypothetical protein [Crocinitomicaceae bacterium]
MKRIILVIFLFNSVFSNAQTWEDSSYIPIDLILKIDQKCAEFYEFPAFFELYEDDSLVIKIQFDSINQEFSLPYIKESTCKITRDHNYKLISRGNDYVLDSEDNFSTFGIKNPTKIIRISSCFICCKAGFEDEFTFFSEDLSLKSDSTFLNSIELIINTSDSAEIEIMYHYVEKNEVFDARIEYLENLLLNAGYDYNQFGFTFGQSARKEEYFTIMIVKL